MAKSCVETVVYMVLLAIISIMFLQVARRDWFIAMVFVKQAIVLSTILIMMDKLDSCKIKLL
jgi:hypothetical protein